MTWTGQILPAAKLCVEARKRGIISIVDAAHSFAHLDYKISDFTCDYFGTVCTSGCVHLSARA